ncbi:hypothetical protein ABIF86_000406 [Bradyrhizobium japonicum]
MMGARLQDEHHLLRMIARTDGNARFWMVANGLAGRGTDEIDAVAATGRPVAVIQGAEDPFLRIEHFNRSKLYGSVARF